MKPVPAAITLGTPYGRRCCGNTGRPHLWSDHIHKGVDFNAPIGTEVYAAWSGKVTAHNWGPAFGKHIVIDHDPFPDNTPGYWAGYMHLSKILVAPGARVKAGQLIGYSGKTGNVTGPHLHFEVQTANGGWRPNTSVNPSHWIEAQPAEIPSAVKLVGEAVTASGVEYEYRPKWDDPSIAGDGPFTPEWIILHHTGGVNSLHLLESGGKHPPVPGANFLVTRKGLVQVLSGFQTYNAGVGASLKDGDRVLVGKDAMNHYSIGIEIESLGTKKDFTTAQVNAVADLCGALLRGMEVDVSHVMNHATWSSSGKPDTLYPDSWWRETITQSSEGPVATVGRHQMVKSEVVQKIKQGAWVEIDFDADDRIIGPGGPCIIAFQIHLALSKGTGARPRYIKGRFVRDGWGAQATATKDDTTGTDTRAIPAEVPKDSWQSEFTHLVEFDKGKPLAYEVYIEGTGTAVSPIRIVKATALDPV